MKNISIILIALVCGFSSCQKEAEEPTPWVCSPCGEYSGTYSGSFSSSLNTNLDTTLFNSPTTLRIEENPGEVVKVTFDISTAFDAQTADSVVLFFDDAEWSNLDISGEEITMAGPSSSATSQLNATCSNNYQTVDGTIVITGAVTANFNFSLSK